MQTYLGCSLRYLFHYVQGLPPEHISSSLILGSAVHQALARYYLALKDLGKPPEREVLLQSFRSDLMARIDREQKPIHYKSDCPDGDGLLAQGTGLLNAFLEDPGFSGMEVVAVELPLSTPLTVGNDIALVGVIDLLLKDTLGHLVAIDHKTAKNAFTQEAADQDLQFSAYALLLSDNGYLKPGQPLTCGFNLLRKLKSPKVERRLTMRTPADQERFSRLAQAVLFAIEREVFLPCQGWQCGDCPYAGACADW
ncbi:MAG: PD-(D/E)XK nuclease family protein [Desulfuromonadaceae bacterium]|nr:PD-(D/E)XK nuclease family protein [Desulfuromonadaceae bacterium]